MNPITIVGGVAAVALFAYSCNTFYNAGQAEVQGRWDKAVLKWQEEKSTLQTKVRDLERGLVQSQTEIRNARESEKLKEAALLASQRTRADVAVAGLRNTAAELAKRLNSKSDDSAALAECKTTAGAYQRLHDSCVGRYRELAETAQLDLATARGRGLECQASYDAAEAALKRFGVEKAPN